jgi:hypothetical protein
VPSLRVQHLSSRIRGQAQVVNPLSTLDSGAASTAAGHWTSEVRFRDLPPPRVVFDMEARSARAGDADVGDTKMPIRLRLLTLGFAVALVVAAPLSAQESPAAPADRSAQATRTQRQDRARIHQPAQADVGQRANAGQRAENRQGRDGATRGSQTQSRATREGTQGNRGSQGARGSRGNQGSQGVRGSRGGQVRDNAARSRVRGTTRTRSRVHRTAP